MVAYTSLAGIYTQDLVEMELTQQDLHNLGFSLFAAIAVSRAIAALQQEHGGRQQCPVCLDRFDAENFETTYCAHRFCRSRCILYQFSAVVFSLSC